MASAPPAALCAVCIPEFPPAALAAIQALRLEHDPGHATRIAPHVTLVFPTDLLPEAGFRAQVRAVAGRSEAARLHFDSATAWREPDGSAAYVFLVPAQGAERLRQLHEALHAGPLAAARDPRRPWFAHLTVARCARLEDAQAVAARITAAGPAYPGTMTAIEVLRVGAAIDRIESIPLRERRH